MAPPRRRLAPLAVPALCAALLLAASCQSPHPSRRNGGLRLDLHTVPQEIDLAECRRFLAEAVLLNTGRQPVLIEWPSGPRFDAELFAPDGSLLHRWSDDRPAGEHGPGLLMLNPGERAFFEMVMPTRGMTPGKPHRLTARIHGSRPLEARATVTPSASDQQ